MDWYIDNAQFKMMKLIYTRMWTTGDKTSWHIIKHSQFQMSSNVFIFCLHNKMSNTLIFQQQQYLCPTSQFTVSLHNQICHRLFVYLNSILSYIYIGFFESYYQCATMIPFCINVTSEKPFIFTYKTHLFNIYKL